MAATTQGRLFDEFIHGDSQQEIGKRLGAIEAGTAVLSSGQVTVTSHVDLTAESQIYVSLYSTGGTVTSTYRYAVLAADITAGVAGTATFVIKALGNDNATVITADTSKVRFIVFPPIERSVL